MGLICINYPIFLRCPQGQYQITYKLLLVQIHRLAILLGGTTTVQGRLIVGTATVANSGTSTVYSN